MFDPLGMTAPGATSTPAPINTSLPMTATFPMTVPSWIFVFLPTSDLISTLAPIVMSFETTVLVPMEVPSPTTTIPILGLVGRRFLFTVQGCRKLWGAISENHAARLASKTNVKDSSPILSRLLLPFLEKGSDARAFTCFALRWQKAGTTLVFGPA